MRTLSSLMKTRIVRPIKNRWVNGAIHVAVLTVFLFCFPDAVAAWAKGFYGPPRHPVAFWLATGFTALLSVWFFYAIIDEWRHGPKRLRKKDGRDTPQGTPIKTDGATRVP